MRYKECETIGEKIALIMFFVLMGITLIALVLCITFTPVRLGG